jgi:Mrp family chromosome partitioning ATPase
MSTQAFIFQGLIYSLLQQPRSDAQRSLVFCFTSVHPGEGVTHVVQALANEVAVLCPERVARVDLGYLQTRAPSPTTDAPIMIVGNTAETASWSQEEVASPAGADLSDYWHGSPRYRRQRIDELRSHFDYTLIDCPPLGTNLDVLGVAPVVDGVILVVEANRTRSDQVLRAEHQIQAAGGVIRGHILNKQKQFVPQWLQRRLAIN